MLTKLTMMQKTSWKAFLLVLAVVAAIALILTGGEIVSAGWGPKPADQTSPMHPEIALLDASGENVLETGKPVSTDKTCGACHDTGFISSHSDHANLDTLALPGPGEAFSGETTGFSEENRQAEMNCLLCHTGSPNNAARLTELASGNYEWATTATLLGSGIVEGEGGDYEYQPAAFTPDGMLAENLLSIQDPANENCGQCHDTVHASTTEMLTLPDDPVGDWQAFTTGQVFSPQEISESGINAAGKDDLDRSFDVHAERNLSCTDCHYSLNNPVYYQEDSETKPGHLEFDPRRLELGEYLYQPLHQLALGGSASGVEGTQTSDAMRSCEGCHSVEATHNWLPYKERHTAAIRCETCHIPQITAPAYSSVDWTVLQDGGGPRIDQRGITGDGLVTGYQPALLSVKDNNGGTQVAPYNLVATWYWIAGESDQPVSQSDLERVWFDGGTSSYAREIIDRFDQNSNGSLETTELAIDNEEKQKLIASRLEALGYENPRIAGAVQPLNLNHSVASGDWAIRECSTCHSAESALEEPFLLSSYLPGGTTPILMDSSGAEIDPDNLEVINEKLYYLPGTGETGLYVLGKDAVGWIDLFGGLAFTGVLLAIAGHGTLRFLSSMRHSGRRADVKQVYMYTTYERLWHWLQTFTILGLIFTGLVIHKPDIFGIFSFRYVVLVHNILAAILVVNAGLSLFYHLASGEIKQYLPRPAGFFDRAIIQARYYLNGIFKGEPHPFEKTPDKKLNPLQQVTYFGLLNILLPLQVITGALMWGAQQWPELTARLGGLPFLAPFHSLIAWLLASFVVAHVYLTTTGHEPLASIRAMMSGWDELEVTVPAEEAGD